MKTAISLVAVAFLMGALNVDVGAQSKTLIVHKHSEMIGKAIKNKTNDHLGYLDDLVIDTRGGRIAYAVLSTRNALGVGGQLHALPLSAFGMAPDRSHLILDLAKNAFEKEAGFDANAWPDQCDARWVKLARHTGTHVKPEGKLVRLTSLNGLSIKNNAGEELGRVQGFGIDCTNDKIGYAAMAYGGVAGVGTKYFAIPWQALHLKSPNLRVQDQVFVMNVNKADFETTPGFNYNDWPNTGEERFLKNAKKASER